MPVCILNRFINQFINISFHFPRTLSIPFLFLFPSCDYHTSASPSIKSTQSSLFHAVGTPLGAQTPVLLLGLLELGDVHDLLAELPGGHVLAEHDVELLEGAALGLGDDEPRDDGEEDGKGAEDEADLAAQVGVLRVDEVRDGDGDGEGDEHRDGDGDQVHLLDEASARHLGHDDVRQRADRETEGDAPDVEAGHHEVVEGSAGAGHGANAADDHQDHRLTPEARDEERAAAESVNDEGCEDRRSHANGHTDGLQLERVVVALVRVEYDAVLDDEDLACDLLAYHADDGDEETTLSRKKSLLV